MISIQGHRSAIAQELIRMLPEGEEWTPDPEPDFPRYFLCRGALFGKPIGELSDDEVKTTFDINFVKLTAWLDDLFLLNPQARVVVMGSMSGEQGSYDFAYAGAKAALHCYVRNKKLTHPGQQLVAIAPTIIEDTGMTQARGDLVPTLERGRKRRMGRWLTAREVARLACFLLYVDHGAISNTVIEMTGGNW